MKLQNILRGTVAACTVAIALSAAGCTDPKDFNGKLTITRGAVDGLPTVVATQKTTGEATITAVDFDKRTVDLKGSDGKVQSFKVPKSVVNFKQVKQGDVVKVKYSEAIEAHVRKSPTEPQITEAGVIATAPPGDKPGIFAYRLVESNCTVQKIDYIARTITLVGMSDKPVSFKVSDLLTNFENIKVGDQVIFTYSESLVIEVAPPASAPAK